MFSNRDFNRAAVSIFSTARHGMLEFVFVLFLTAIGKRSKYVSSMTAPSFGLSVFYNLGKLVSKSFNFTFWAYNIKEKILNL